MNLKISNDVWMKNELVPKRFDLIRCKCEIRAKLNKWCVEWEWWCKHECAWSACMVDFNPTGEFIDSCAWEWVSFILFSSSQNILTCQFRMCTCMFIINLCFDCIRYLSSIFPQISECDDQFTWRKIRELRNWHVLKLQKSTKS